MLHGRLNAEFQWIIWILDITIHQTDLEIVHCESLKIT